MNELKIRFLNPNSEDYEKPNGRDLSQKQRKPRTCAARESAFRNYRTRPKSITLKSQKSSPLQTIRSESSIDRVLVITWTTYLIPIPALFDKWCGARSSCWPLFKGEERICKRKMGARISITTIWIIEALLARTDIDGCVDLFF